MAQLAEAYVHLNPYSASHRKIEGLGKFLDRISARGAAEVYRQTIVIDVEIEEGSLRTWVTLSGMLMVYSAIADYKGFKESIGELVNDARTVAEYVITPFLARADASKDQVFRTERRLKTPGRLYRLVRRLERIEMSIDQLSPNDVKAELYQARVELEKIRKDLTDKELNALEQNLSLPHIPPPSRWPKAPPPGMPKVAIKEEERQPSLFSPEFGFKLPPPPKERHREKVIVYQHRTILQPKSGRQISDTRRDLLGQ
jgi:hypothetical protein